MIDYLTQRLRRCLPLAAFLTLSGFCLTASAQGEDFETLKKRVEALEAQLENPLAGWGKAPYIQSEDGLFSIQFGTRLQLRYTYQGRDTGHGNTSGADRSYAELERARLKFQGNFFTKDLKYKVEFDGQSDGATNPTDLYLTYSTKTSDAHSITFGGGQFKPYFGRQEKTSSSKQLLVDRSLANEFFSVDRNIGFWLDGRLQLNEDGAFNAIGYHLAITNGFDSVNTSPTGGQTDQIPAVIVHIDFDILGNLGKDALSSGDHKRRESPGFTTGFSFASDENNNSGGVSNLQFKIQQFALDMVYKHFGFNLNVEYFGRFLELPGDGMNAFFTHGGYIEAGYFVCDDGQIVARASAVWDREGSGSSANEVAVGFNYFFMGHNLKISADVGFVDIPPGMLAATEQFPGATAATRNFSSGSANLATMQGVLARVQAQLNF